MADFNIESLIEFEPPQMWCGKCFALFGRYAYGKSAFNHEKHWKLGYWSCPICNVKYIPTDEYGFWDLGKFIDNKFSKPLKNIENIIDHTKQLALISKRFRSGHTSDFRSLNHIQYPPLRGFFEAIIRARSFIHFTSFGITQLILGSLKASAQFVDIRGVVSGSVGEHIISEVTDFKSEAPNLSIKFLDSGDFRTEDVPHQKLIIIDGLLAFKGSANLTQTAWRSAERGMDMLEIVTDVNEIGRLNNRFFSPVWGKMNEQIGEEIEMTILRREFRQPIR